MAKEKLKDLFLDTLMDIYFGKKILACVSALTLHPYRRTTVTLAHCLFPSLRR